METMGLKPQCAADVESAKQQLCHDVSQNLAWGKSRRDPRILGALCRQHIVYSYGQDSVLLPEELWHAMGGLADGEALANFDGISDQEAIDLLGECQALQPLVLAT
jgi:hypothetical protein